MIFFCSKIYIFRVQTTELMLSWESAGYMTADRQITITCTVACNRYR